MNRFLFNKVIYNDIYDEDKKMNKKDYPSAIRKLRAKLNISQQELADMLGVSFPSVNRWENGHYEPTIIVKVRLEELLNQNNIELCEVSANENN